MHLVGLDRGAAVIDVDVRALVRRADALLVRSEQLLVAAVGSRAPIGDVVSVQRASANRKLAPQRQIIHTNGRRRNEPLGPYVTSTYVSIRSTCPDSCRFKAGGCYAQAGAAQMHQRELDRAAWGLEPLEVTRREAAAIDALWHEGVPQDGARGGRDLRLHVGGEVSCKAGAELLAGAARRWRLRGGGHVFTFTHRWRHIPRAAWGQVRVLASCETEAEAAAATRRGYDVAITVPKFPRGRKRFWVGKLTAIPCPNEAGAKTTCATCRLCVQRPLRARGLAIAFAIHGQDADLAAAAIARWRA